jgi:diguanylate cyclase (GGDEF)-like protein/PAS domain S-box-containing protein
MNLGRNGNGRRNLAAAACFDVGFTSSPTGMAVTDLAGSILRVNPALARMLGRPEAELLKSPLAHIVHPDEREEDAVAAQAVLQGHSRTLQSELRLLTADNHELWALSVIVAVPGDDGRPVAMIRHFADISDRKDGEARLTSVSLRDPLTGLPNRVLFLDRLHHALARGRRRNSSTAVILVDLDGFRAVNDNLGPEAGNLLLGQVSERLHQSMRSSDTLARFDGDQFALLCEDVCDSTRVAAIVERVQLAVAVALPEGLFPGEMSASLGVAMAGPGQEADEVLRRADLAAYRARRDGPGSVAFEMPVSSASGS